MIMIRKPCNVLIIDSQLGLILFASDELTIILNSNVVKGVIFTAVW